MRNRVQNLTFGKRVKKEVEKKSSKLRVKRKEKDGKNCEKDQNDENKEKKDKTIDKGSQEKSRGLSHLLNITDSDYSVCQGKYQIEYRILPFLIVALFNFLSLSTLYFDS